MAALGESKSARKHVGTVPAVSASDLNDGCDEHFISIKKDLSLVKGLSEAKVEKIVEAAMKLELCNSFISGGELISRRAKVVKMTTGSPQLDLLLGGGIESMSITEIFGENRCGKTQICHTLCVTAQLPREMGGGCGKVCYIDTEGTFRPEKIHLIAERFSLDGEGALNNILYARAYTTEHMHQLFTIAAAKMSEEKFALLIVDSIMALFRVDFCGRGELAERQQKLNKMLSSLIKIAEQYNISVVITNQVMSDPGGGLTFVANPTKPVGGHVLGHASTTRLSLRKSKGSQRICKIFDAPNLPENETPFQLTAQGITDAVE